jgi:ATP-dependent Clp protease ATP-binding subunit ClpC
MEEARSLNHNYVATEHILLGLCRLKDGGAVRVFANLGLTPDAVRQMVFNLLNPPATQS